MYLSVVYLDDFLLLGSSSNECLHNVRETVALLEYMGFIINKAKSQLLPKTVCRFLGFIFNSREMTLELPKEKRNKISQLMRALIEGKKLSIRKFSQIVGIIVSAWPAVQYGWLYTKKFERAKYLAFQKSGGSYSQVMCIPNTISEETRWWIDNIHSTKMLIDKGPFVLEIFSDASTTGWGAACAGQTAAGQWSKHEASNHINYLELLSAFFSLQCFASNLKNCSVLLRVDNTTTIAYINRMGGIRFPNLNGLTRKIWEWCESRRLWIFASYIKSQDNTEADRESRKLSFETEWELEMAAFDKIATVLGQPEIDLFASRLNRKCEKFVSRKNDPESSVIDAFTINWKSLYFYAFPPFSMVLKTLQKITHDNATGIVVVPFWKSQPWFPFYESMLKSDPIYFTPNSNLLTCPYTRKSHPLWRKITLVAGVLSPKPSDRRAYQKSPSRSSSPPSPIQHTTSMIVS